MKKLAAGIVASLVFFSAHAEHTKLSYLIEEMKDFDVTVPRLNDKINYQNRFCTYQDKIPFVKNVAWKNEKIQKALKALLPGYRSTISYGQWRYVYGLEFDRISSSDSQTIKEQRARARARNFIKVLCGEFRDHPKMLEKKLDVLIQATNYAGPNELELDSEKLKTSDENLFAQITAPAYHRMRTVMRAVYSSREKYNAGGRYDYGRARYQPSATRHRVANRLDESVEPWTHCEMRYMFTYWMQKNSPRIGDRKPGFSGLLSRWGVKDYEQGLAQYKKTSCTQKDFAYMYNFRGHKNFKPLWLESNSFIWNSLRAFEEEYKDIAKAERSYNRYAKKAAPYAVDYGKSIKEKRDLETKILNTQHVLSQADTEAKKSELQAKLKALKAQLQNNKDQYQVVKRAFDRARKKVRRARQKLDALLSISEERLDNQTSYYQHPFAERYIRSRMLLGTYFLYPEKDEAILTEASLKGGGRVLYVLDLDQDQNGISDYKLFDKRGCGDQGIGKEGNCNSVSRDEAWDQESTTGAATGYNVGQFWEPDMGLNQVTQTNDMQKTFENRMIRLNQGLDRHTNWGPTNYFAIDAYSTEDEPGAWFRGAYSPIVACSYEISKSHTFASGDYSSTDSFERKRTKWFFIMKFKRADYYNENDLKAGRRIDFDKNYFNEASLSNDRYDERALDRFGWIPVSDVHANLYFVYGDRGSFEGTPDIPHVFPSPEEDR